MNYHKLPWNRANILEMEKELTWRRLENEKRKEVILSGIITVARSKTFKALLRALKLH